MKESIDKKRLKMIRKKRVEMIVEAIFWSSWEGKGSRMHVEGLALANRRATS